MGASAIEFRLRMLINTIIVVLGFWAPWIEAWGIGRRISLLEWTALELTRRGHVPFHVATAAVVVLATILALDGAVFRVWGSAYLGPAVVAHPDMNAEALMAGGPYRFVRNPLYIGLWFMVAALAFLMPPTGALFTMALLSFFLARLILGEEAFLRARLGDRYEAYLQAVPRLVPFRRSKLPRSSQEARWLPAVFSELTPIGVLFTLAALSWSYDLRLMQRAILISFGASLVVRALMPGLKREKDA